jgi:hypothetical protein
MNDISKLSRGFRALLLCFTWATLAQGGQPSGGSASQATADLSTKRDYWAVEDAQAREKLPLYKIIPAANPNELTPANGYPKTETFLTWHRSHGDNGGRRYSALDLINRQNVSQLQRAWVYHSGDGSNNLQCNPILVRGLRFRLSDADIRRQVRTGANGMAAFPTMSEADLKAVTDYLLLRDRATLPAKVKSERPLYGFTGYPRFLDNEGYPASKPPWGTLNCLDREQTGPAERVWRCLRRVCVAGDEVSRCGWF